MLVITTPTGQIGSGVVAGLLRQDLPVRVIARDPLRLSDEVRDRVQVVQGSQDDPAVLDQALTDAEALFFLVPPGLDGGDAQERYLGFARPAAEAIRRQRVGHVVALSSAGHDWPQRSGVISAAFAAEAELRQTGVAFRALSPPFFMENLLGQLDAIRDQGGFRLAHTADRPLATVATRDIAAVAVGLLADRSWDGQQNVPVFGPDRCSPNDLAAVISELLGRPVAFAQTGIDDLERVLIGRGASAGAARDMVEMIVAQNAGIYDAEQALATPGPTDFRTWCADVLRPAALA